jgi:hypothetical protein
MVLDHKMILEWVFPQSKISVLVGTGNMLED